MNARTPWPTSCVRQHLVAALPLRPSHLLARAVWLLLAVMLLDRQAVAAEASGSSSKVHLAEPARVYRTVHEELVHTVPRDHLNVAMAQLLFGTASPSPATAPPPPSATTRNVGATTHGRLSSPLGGRRTRDSGFKTQSLNNNLVNATAVTVNIAVMVFHALHVPVASAQFGPLSPNYTDPADLPTTTLQAGWQQGLQLYRDVMNNDMGGFGVSSNGQDYLVRIVVDFFPVALPLDSAANQTANMLRFMNDTIRGRFGSYPVIVAPPSPYMSSDTSVRLAEVCESSQACLLILPITIDPTVFICTKDAVTNLVPSDCAGRRRNAGSRRFKYMATVAPPSLQVSDDWLIRMQVLNMKQIAILSDTYWLRQTEDTVQAATSNGIPIVWQQTIDPVTDVRDVAYWMTVVQSIRDSGADGLIVNVGYTATEGLICSNLLQAMRALDYFPSALHFACSCTAVAPYVSPEFVSGQLSNYTYGVSQWDQTMHGPNYRAPESTLFSTEVFSATSQRDSPAIFYEAFLRRFPQSTLTSQIAAQAALVPMLIHKCVEGAAVVPWTATDLASQVGFVAGPGHYGAFLIDRFGRVADRPYAAVQVIGADNRVIAPIGLFNPVFPAPNWPEREYVNQFNVETGERVMMGVAAVAELAALLVGAALLYYRHHAIVRAASLPFCATMIVGAMVEMSTVFVWSMDMTDQACALVPWLLTTGAAMMYAPMVVKSYRLKVIFLQRQLSVIRLKNKHLASVVTAMMSVFVLILVGWQLTTPPHAVMVRVDPYRPASNYNSCATSATSVGCAYTLMALILLMLGANTVLATMNRGIPSNFNESSHTLFTVYVNVVVLVILLPLVISGQDRTTQYLYRNMGVLIIGITNVMGMFVPKLVTVWYGQVPSDLTHHVTTTHTAVRLVAARSTGGTASAGLTGGSPTANTVNTAGLGLVTVSSMRGDGGGGVGVGGGGGDGTSTMALAAGRMLASQSKTTGETATAGVGMDPLLRTATKDRSVLLTDSVREAVYMRSKLDSGTADDGVLGEDARSMGSRVHGGIVRRDRPPSHQESFSHSTGFPPGPSGPVLSTTAASAPPHADSAAVRISPSTTSAHRAAPSSTIPGLVPESGATRG